MTMLYPKWHNDHVYNNVIEVQINPDRTRCSGSTERMRVIGEARSIPFFPD